MFPRFSVPERPSNVGDSDMLGMKCLKSYSNCSESRKSMLYGVSKARECSYLGLARDYFT